MPTETIKVPYDRIETEELPWSAIPGPPPMPVLGWRGNLIRFMRDRIGYMRMLRRDYGRIATIVRSGKRGMIFAFGPEFNEQLLSNAHIYLNAGITDLGPEHSANRRVGLGLLSMNGESHKEVRQLLMPFFSSKAVQAYHHSILQHCDRMLDRWSPGRRIDLWREMRQFMKVVSCALLFGMDNPKKALRAMELADR